MSGPNPVRQNHFKENCLAWAALHHFLPSELVHELSCAIIDVVSDNKLTIEKLFDQEFAGLGQGLGSWMLRPLEVQAPLDQYLQRRVRAFTWASDTDVGYDSKGIETAEISPSSIEEAVRLGQADLGFPVEALDKMTFAQTSVSSFVAAFKVLKSFQARLKTESVAPALVGACANLSMPLFAVVVKHFGDLCADADEWENAHSLYQQAISALSKFNDPAWDEFTRLLKGIVLQSCAAALRTTKGAGASSEFLTGLLQKAPLAEQPLFQLNASHDALVVTSLASEKFAFSADRRASILLAPLLLKTHDLASAHEASTERDFSEAHRYFWQVLRRQIALGSASDSRITKAFYARSFFKDLEKSIDRDNKPDLFLMAVRLMLESGQVKVAKQLVWNERVVRSYLADATVDSIIAHADKNEGSRNERRKVLIELFGSWTRCLTPVQSEFSKRLQTYLAGIANDDTLHIFGQENAGQRCLELLNELAESRPEFRSIMTKTVANVIVARMSVHAYWTVHAEAMKLADTYLDSFSPNELVEVITAVLTFLDKIDPANGAWVIVQPALGILASTESKHLSEKDPILGRRIFSTVLRFGLNQDTEHARLLFYLQDFDIKSADAPMLAQLKEVVDDVRRKAGVINASNAVENIQALLVAPTIVGEDGVKDAITALIAIMNSAIGKRPSLSFAYAYTPLLLLAARQDKIADNIKITANEFRCWLKPVLDLFPAIWAKSQENPLIFAQFSLPEATKPNSVVIHNWAYASINFALSMNDLPPMLAILDSAAQVPVLRESISMARATRLAASEWKKFDPAAMQSEDRDTFYSALGQRLAQIRKIPSDARLGVIRSLLDQCFRQGPHGLDLAVFLTAIDMGVSDFETNSEYRSYVKRLDNDRELRLAIGPTVLDTQKNTD